MARPSMPGRSMSHHIDHDVKEFSGDYDSSAPPVGLSMDGHDTHIMGPKLVMLDSFVADLLNVDTSAQTFRLKLLVNMDWEDDGTIKPEVKAKRNLGRSVATSFGTIDENSPAAEDLYKTGKYVLKEEFREDPLSSTWNPEVVLINAIADEDPIEAGSKFHSVQMLSGRPVISRTVLYQPECRCEFDFSDYPFDETDLVVKLGSNKWNSEQVQFTWTHRLLSMGRDVEGRRISRFTPLRKMSISTEKAFLEKSVDKSAVGGVGLSEFEIIKVRVETDEKDVNSMQRYDNAEGAFSQAHLIIRVRRDPYSYLLRVASVAELLMFLEVLSFLTDSGDLSARFGISGTNFLAMVSLYGPMADALPQVSVVTRVDKWHLFNFFLLFASNVENLMAFMLQSIVGETRLHYVECLLGVLYLYSVGKNLIWFCDPLREREEFNSIVEWCTGRANYMYNVRFRSWVRRMFLWRRSGTGEEGPREVTFRKLGSGVHSAVPVEGVMMRRPPRNDGGPRP